MLKYQPFNEGAIYSPPEVAKETPFSEKTLAKWRLDSSQNDLDVKIGLEELVPTAGGPEQPLPVTGKLKLVKKP